MKKKKEKKKYEKPKIIYQKQIETLAAYCDSNWGGPQFSCRLTPDDECYHLQY